jgi:hypothetical protein
MKDQTKKPSSSKPTQKDNITKKLRDISLEDLDGVTGGNAANCDMDSKAALS